MFTIPSLIIDCVHLTLLPPPLVQGLNSTQRSEEINLHQLRIMVDTRKRSYQEKQQREAEEREAEERRRRDEEERIRKEERLAKIKRDQEMAKKKAALESVMVHTLHTL